MSHGTTTDELEHVVAQIHEFASKHAPVSA